MALSDIRNTAWRLSRKMINHLAKIGSLDDTSLGTISVPVSGSLSESEFWGRPGSKSGESLSHSSGSLAESKIKTKTADLRESPTYTFRHPYLNTDHCTYAPLLAANIVPSSYMKCRNTLIEGYEAMFSLKSGRVVLYHSESSKLALTWALECTCTKPQYSGTS